MERWTVAIDRADIRRAWLVEGAARELVDGEVEFAIDLVALTANNVTYAALGEPNGFLGEDAGYWDFFSGREEPGRLPVWGFATVARSRVPGLAPGEALYGYWPLASHAVLRAERVGAVGFTAVDGARARLPALYNSYQRVAALPDHRAADHALWPVWRPLHITGWLAADQLADEGDHGVSQVLVTAASSKTALAFADAMRQRRERPRLMALTSPRSASFVRASGLYDQVTTYDEVGTVARVPSALVDFANAADVVTRVRAALGERLRFDLVIGYTHWDAASATRYSDLPRTMFFAPARLAKRGAEWGGEVLRQRLASAWTQFMQVAPRLTGLDERAGAAAALASWEEAVNGRADPGTAVLLRP
jgi:hypothetical protein